MYFILLTESSETLPVLGVFRVFRVFRVYQLQVFKLSPADSYCSNTRQLLSCPPSPQLPLSLLYLLLHASLQSQLTLSTTSQSNTQPCSPRLLLGYSVTPSVYLVSDYLAGVSDCLLGLSPVC